jgi:hypothetical protein
VRDIVRNHPHSPNEKIAVVGSGVMGLTAATLLAELGLTVTIYAKDFWSRTTSSKAGGQWAASVVEFNKRQEFKEILESSYRTFKSSIGHGFGVSEQPNYTATRSHNLDIVLELSPNLIPQPAPLHRMPFEHHTHSGFKYQTLLIEPPIFLPKLENDLRARNVQFVCRAFSSQADVLSLQENIIINCTGLGSKTLWNDTALSPIKGQLVLLPAQPDLQYLYGQSGYLFPRKDAVVVGGTFEKEGEFTHEGPDDDKCKEIVDHMRSLFGQAPSRPLATWHIHHEKNKPPPVKVGAHDV